MYKMLYAHIFPSFLVMVGFREETKATIWLPLPLPNKESIRNMLDGCSNGKLQSCFAAPDNHDYRQGMWCSSIHKVLLDTSFHVILSHFLFVA